MSKITYKAVAPDGSVHTRKTERTYTHAIATSKDGETWGVISWCGRPDLAEKEFRRIDAGYWREYNPDGQVKIVEVSS